MKTKHIIVFTGGLLFGFGLAFGGMSKQEIVLSFLQLKDLGLLILLGGSAFVTALTINLVPKALKKPKPAAVRTASEIIGATMAWKTMAKIKPATPQVSTRSSSISFKVVQTKRKISGKESNRVEEMAKTIIYHKLRDRTVFITSKQLVHLKLININT